MNDIFKNTISVHASLKRDCTVNNSLNGKSRLTAEKGGTFLPLSAVIGAKSEFGARFEFK
jgi:hypothetical protein